ncbi:MAG: gliding motility-associated C-terminal domain-containing protein [Bacteroidales bacterium]|jgi:gliding motility-associated-like protein|nr:gliding motility-associated C-terminal domain-containing protein [Bacteroidales bacterium]
MNILTTKNRAFLCMVFGVFSFQIYAQPSVRTVLTDNGQCYAIVNGISFSGSPTGYYLTGATTSSSTGNTTDASGNQFNVGVTDVFYYDLQDTIAAYTIIVVPRIAPPVVSATRYAASGMCEYTVVGTEFDPVIANGCTVPTGMTLSSLSGTVLPVGINIVTVESKLQGVQMQTEDMTITVEDTISPTIGKQTLLTVYLDGTGSVTLVPQDLIITASDNCSDSTDLDYKIKRLPGSFGNSVTFDCSDTTTIPQSVQVKVTDLSGNSTEWEANITVKDTISPVVLCKENIIIYLDSHSGQYTLTPSDLFDSVFDNCTDSSALWMRLILNHDNVLLNDFTFNCSHVGDTLVTVLIRDNSGNLSICEKTVTIAYYESRTPAPIVESLPENGEICNGSPFTLRLSNDGFDEVTRWEWTTSPVVGITGNSSGAIQPTGTYELQQTLNNSTQVYDSVTYVISAVLYSQCLLTGTGIVRYATVNPTLIPVAVPDTNICNSTHVHIPLHSTSVVSRHAEILFRWTVGNNSEVTGWISGDGRPVGDTINQLLFNKTTSTQDVSYTIRPYLSLNNYSCTSNPTTLFTVKVQPSPRLEMVSSVSSAICSGDTVSLTASMSNTLSDATWSYATVAHVPAGMTVSGSVASTPGIFQLSFDNADVNKLEATYVFDPIITITSLNQVCLEKNDSTVIGITVNPIPALLSAFSGNDSLCHDEGTAIRLLTQNLEVAGLMKYHLDVNYDASSVANVLLTPGTYGWQDEIDQTDLQNISEQVQTVRYIFMPTIDVSGKMCNGESDTVIAYIAPELKFDLQPSSYAGGWNVQCHGGNTGKINIRSLQGAWGTFGYDYLWNTGAATDSVFQLRAGDYSVTVTNRVYGCHASETITMEEPQKIGIVANVTKPVCNGPTGKIELQVSGGTRTYEYQWNGPEHFVSVDSAATSLRAGNYYITVNDANACDTSFTVVMPAGNSSELFPNWNESRYGIMDGNSNTYYNISCHGANDGYVLPRITVQNIVVYTLWEEDRIVKTDTAPSSTIFPVGSIRVENLSAGKYHLTVVDEAGCTYETAPIFIRQPSPVTFDTSVLVYPSGFEIDCYGSETGQIEILNIEGGYGTYYGPYEYVWTSVNPVQQGAPTQTQLAAGSYELNIRNKRLSGYCDTTLVFTLRQPPEITVTATIPSHDGFEIACYGQKTGTIEIDVAGNYSEYQFRWDSPNGEILHPASQNQYNLPAGDYRLDVTYGVSGCVLQKQYVLRQPPAIEPNAVIQDVTCYGASDGAVSLSPSGGIPGYRYLWQTPDFGIYISHPTRQNQTDMPPGTYWLVITDTSECVKAITLEIREPDEIKANITAEDPTCTPGNDGFITLQPTGGAPDYSYSWSTGSTGRDITGLSEGDYTVTITDSNNCTATDSARINTPGNLMVEAEVVSNYNGYQVACYGGRSGKINLKIPNGRMPYTCQYILDGNMMDLDPQHAVAGNYQIQVTDQFNCSGVATVLLAQPSKMQLTAVVAEPSCADYDNGSIRTAVTGGVGPYTYYWSGTGADTPVAEQLQAGQYAMTVIDGNQCEIDTLFHLSQPEAIQIQWETVDAYCPEIPDGSIRSRVTGGVAPYVYRWQGLGSALPELNEITSGQYMLEVTDDQNCTATATIIVGYHSNACLRIPNAFSPNADGTNDRWEISAGDPASTATPYALGDLYPEAIIEVYSANWGLLLYRSQKGYPEPWDGRYNGKYLPVNSYVYVIRLRSDLKPITGNVTIIK